MSVREIVLRMIHWVHNRLTTQGKQEYRRLNDEGLIMEHGEEIGEAANPPAGQPGQDNQNAIKAVTVRGKSESLEKLQDGFDRLIDELSGINDHLRKQVSQHEALIERIDQLPKLAESFPASLESQKQLTEQLISQIKANILKDQQTISVIEKIPIEEAKQTDALINIDRQLAAATDVDVQMTETFNKFNQSLEKLNHTTREHSEGISQMSRTFAASDRYLKFIVSRQARQFMWVFYSALGICVAAILVLVGIIIYLSR